MSMQDYALSDNFFSDKRRKEIIDGKIYLMASPNKKHVSIQYNLCSIFNDYFRKGKNKCISILANDLYISKTNWLIPDLLVYCKNNNDKKNKKVPLIVVEILSESTWKRDVTVKMQKYAEMGIEEYWIIDPEVQRLTIYKLDNTKYEPSQLYNLPLPVDEDIPIKPEDDEDEIITEFAPAFFPELIISLEDIFNFENLDIL